MVLPCKFNLRGDTVLPQNAQVDEVETRKTEVVYMKLFSNS